MMKRVVCDETFPHPALQLFLDNWLHKLIEQQHPPSTLLSDKTSYEKDFEIEEQKCFTTTMVRSLLLSPPKHTHTHTTAFYDERLLGCKFLQYLFRGAKPCR
jgi:hypothetical protein